MQGVKATEIALELRDSNLYANGNVVTYDDGSVELEVDFPEYIGRRGDTYHTVKILDTLDKIAWDRYKDEVPVPEDYWFAIAVANDIENPFDLSQYIGQEILIPDILNFRLLYVD